MDSYNANCRNINPQIFLHQADKAITEKILHMQAFQKALQFISRNSIEKLMGGIYKSSLAQLTPQTSPVIFRMLDQAAGLYGAPVIPDIFLVREYSMTVNMIGIEKPMIVISTELLRSLSQKALWGILASEVSGTATGFCRIKFVEWLCNSSMGLLPDAVIKPLKLVFQNWHKYAQYSFDRANLIATEDFNITMQAILAGEAPKETLESIAFDNPGCEYMKQCREFLSDDNKAVKAARDSNAIFGEYGYYASRYLELFRFYQSEYHDLMEEYGI